MGLFKVRAVLVKKIKEVSIRYGFSPYLRKIKTLLESRNSIAPCERVEHEAARLNDNHSLAGRVVLKYIPEWQDISVVYGEVIRIKAQVEYSGNKKAILILKTYDKNGNNLDIKLGKLSFSTAMQSYFKYLQSTGKNKQILHQFKIPEQVKKIHVGFAKFNASPEDKVVLKGLEILSIEEVPSVKFTPPTIKAAEISILGWPEYPENGKPYVIGVMDEFTTGCFDSELNLIQPRPDNWYALAEKYSPAVFFIESAWKGNNGSWQYRVGEYSNKPGYEVAHMVEYAESKGIPSVFWNKEDPVHHHKFMSTAKLADHIFTTDANMCESYRKHTGNSNVHTLPFAAQPAIHKPAALAGRLKRSCFAGSWYGNRHAERGVAMGWLIEAAHRQGLDIYDRNHGAGIFPFPERYHDDIKGSLPYKELCDEYRRYRVFLNVNSVTNSPTMFSRRVFELMASGTPVVSTYARGIEELFESDAVWMVSNEAEAEEAIYTLLNDDNEWRRRSLAGIREVFSRHTYAHRLNDVFEKIGVEQRMMLEPQLLLLARAESEFDLRVLHYFVREQTYRKFVLMVECPDDVLNIEGPAKVLLVPKGAFSTHDFRVKYFETERIGWLSVRRHYGVDYLRDLVNSMSYQPETLGWAKSSGQDAFEFGQPAVLSGSIWKREAFIQHWLGSDPDKIIQHEELFTIDCNEFSAQSSYQLIGAEHER